MLMGARISSLELRLEPLRDASSGEIIGRETRWELFDGGQTLDAEDLLREEYAPEEYGLVDRWALRSALAIASEFSHERPTTSVHVDVRSIVDTDQARELYQWLRDYGSQLPHLALEIDERFITQHADTLGGFARAVRRLGLCVVVDNARNVTEIEAVLRHVHGDAIKIDGALIAGLARDMSARCATARLVQSAHAHGMYAIALGVHDPQTWERARDIGCDRVQGMSTFPT